MTLKSRIIHRWDRWVYWLAYRSLKRLCESDGGFAYLFELFLRKWRSEHPIPPELERSTEVFFDSVTSFKGPLGTSEVCKP